MQAPVPYKLLQQQLWLSPDRCIFWEEEKTLIVSDLHFGKTGHFRKFGIPVPQKVYKEDLQRLFNQVQHFQPRQLIIVGDMFHSRENKEVDMFRKWRQDFPGLDIHLVKGNHDILKDTWYQQSGINITEDELQISHFRFRHDPAPPKNHEHYFFAGHIHPGIRISGLGRQSLSFPCFYFAKEYCVLPAFGGFTGTALISPGEGENVFAIVENRIVQLQ
jgi:DNA ligase-associated metallophosphoesterase